MKPEELLQMLRDAGMQDADIGALLDEAKGMLEPAPEEPAEPTAEEMDKVYGAI